MTVYYTTVLELKKQKATNAIDQQRQTYLEPLLLKKQNMRKLNMSRTLGNIIENIYFIWLQPGLGGGY